MTYIILVENRIPVINNSHKKKQHPTIGMLFLFMTVKNIAQPVM